MVPVRRKRERAFPQNPTEVARRVTNQDAYGRARATPAVLEQPEAPIGAHPLLRLAGCTGRFWRDALLRRLGTHDRGGRSGRMGHDS